MTHQWVRRIELDVRTLDVRTFDEERFTEYVKKCRNTGGRCTN
ncbi:hypothetical protein ABZ348_10735 [Streptomyces sp. NPDC005963]